MLISSFLIAAEKPNVVFILTDDQAPWALGLSGHPHANTPNLDKLFKQGMWLKKGHTRLQPLAHQPDDQQVRQRAGHHRLDSSTQ
jgi:hypothetical protein